MKIRFIQPVLLTLLILTSCSKKEDCDDPIDCLPAITQTGANTAGCLVNGKILLPDGQGINSGSVLKAQYNFSEEGDAVFGLSIMDLTSGQKMMLIEIRNRKLIEGETYELKSSDSKSLGYYFDSYNEFVTTDNHKGELRISKIDIQKRIVSGTFWFDAVDKNGEILEIRDGRFDVLYY